MSKNKSPITKIRKKARRLSWVDRTLQVALGVSSSLLTALLVSAYHKHFNSDAHSSSRVFLKIPAEPSFLAELNAAPLVQKRLNMLAYEVSPPVRAKLTACVRNSQDSALYQDAARYSPDREQETLLALTATCISQNTSDQNTSERIRKLAFLQLVFSELTKPVPEKSEIVEGVIRKLVIGTSRPKPQSVDAAAFSILNDVLQDLQDTKYPLAWKKEQDRLPLVALGVNIFPPLKEGVVLKVNSTELTHIANVCYNEAASIRDPNGIRSCAATIFNRFANGRFGASVDSVILTGGFEVIGKFNGIDNLPKASDQALALVKDVVAQSGTDATFGGTMFFQNTRIDQQRGTDFGAALGKTGTVGDPNSFNSHDLYRSYVHPNKKTVDIYQLPKYKIEFVPDAPKRNGRQIHLTSVSYPSS